MLQIRLHEITGHFTFFLVLSILVFNMIIAYAPNAVEPAVAGEDLIIYTQQTSIRLPFPHF